MATASAAQPPPALVLLDEVRALATQAGRKDLASRLTVAAGRLRRPGTVVCVVGEFKQGKSSLVNALLDADACPVDDDLATSVVTIVHHADEPTAVARRATDDGIVTERVALDDVRALVTEEGNPGNEQGLERLDLGRPDDLLATGLTLVDTPGMGGLAAGQTAATLGFLPYADGLLFVTDASQELTRPELELLREATQRCPLVVCVLTKVDLHPHWRQIAEINRGHLEAAGIDIPILPVSAALRRRDSGDGELLDESGVAALLATLDERVVQRAKAAAAKRAAAESGSAVVQLAQRVEAELAVLRDPEEADRLRAEVETAKQRLTHLRGTGAGWRTVLGDRITDLQATTTQELRRLVRETSRGIDEHLAELRSTEDWEAISRDLQTAIATTTSTLFAGVKEAGDAIRSELIDLLADEEVALPELSLGGDAVDITELWGDRELRGDAAGKVTSSISALRGVQSGVLMFGMLGRVLPAAAATLVASNPILLGAGLLLGGKALRDQREQQVVRQRQEAKVAIRQFLDDVQFELGPQLQDAIKQLQRELRDGVGARVAELQESWTDVGKRAQSALKATDTTRAKRLAELEPVEAELRNLALRAKQLEPTDGTP